MEKANVKWFLSINDLTLPEDIRSTDQRIYKSFKLGEQEFDLSTGFEDLHTKSYEQILDGNGYGIHDAKKAIDLVYKIRTSTISDITEESHKYASLPLSKHPFSK